LNALEKRNYAIYLFQFVAQRLHDLQQIHVGNFNTFKRPIQAILLKKTERMAALPITEGDKLHQIGGQYMRPRTRRTVRAAEKQVTAAIAANESYSIVAKAEQYLQALRDYRNAVLAGAFGAQSSVGVPPLPMRWRGRRRSA